MEQAASRWRVPFFDNRTSFTAEWPELARAVDRVFELDRFSHGVVTAELEEAIAAYTGARFAVGVASTVDALELILRATGAGPGSEVIVPAFGPFRTAASVRRLGARPVFADVDPESYTLSPGAARAAITPRTAAVVPVHLFAQVADTAALRTVADRAGVLLVEDCADAIGMRSEGVHAGLVGTAGSLSFSATRTLGAVGDAGMVITDDSGLADRCRLLRHHGRAGETMGVKQAVSATAVLSGMNSKMDEIQAAVLVARLPRLRQAILRRAGLAAGYDRRLASVDQVVGVCTPTAARSTDPVWNRYVVATEHRDALSDFLAGEGIETRRCWPVPPFRRPCSVPPDDRPGGHPVAEAAARRLLALPVYPDLGEEGVEQVCDAIERFQSRGSA